MYTQAIIVVVFSVVIKLDAVPPAACFASFRWENCGAPPVRVLYYWKPGSRCEVGIWRGCLPNMNMFDNEYDCVSTCIFTARAQPEDYHELVSGDAIAPSTVIEKATHIETHIESTTREDTTTIGIAGTTAAHDGISTSDNVNTTST